MASRYAKLFGRNRTEVIGAPEVRRRLKQLGAKVRREIMVPAMEAAMDPMYARAQAEVEVSSGKTKANLVEKTKGQTKGRILVDVMISRVYYAAFHEYGTRFYVGSHTLIKVFDENKTRAVDIALGKIAEGIEARAGS